jgi:hypothetical protein
MPRPKKPVNPDSRFPDDYESERCVIGAVLFGHAEFAAIADLRLEDFNTHVHQILFMAMRDLEQRGDPVDNVSVAHELNAKKQLAKVGGLSYIVGLADAVPAMVNIQRYKHRLQNKTATRQLMFAAQETVNHCLLDDEPIDKLLEYHQSSVSLIDQNFHSQNGNGKHTIEDLPSVWRYEITMNWLLDGIIAENSVTMLTGESGDGKSFFSLKLAGQVSRGLPFLARKTVKTKVLYLDRENPLFVVKDRLELMEIRETKDLTYWGTWNDEIPDGPGANSVMNFVQKHKPLVIFDNKAAFDGGDEQDATATRQHMNQYRRLASLGGTILVLHNTGKSETSKEYRGSSDIKASLDMGYVLERTDGTNSGQPLGAMVLKPFKTRVLSGGIRFDYAGGKFQAATADTPNTRSVVDIVADILRMYPNSSQRQIAGHAKDFNMSKHRVPEALMDGFNSGRFSCSKNGTRNGQTRKWSLAENEVGA